MTIVSNTPMTIFPLTDSEFYTEMFDGECIHYQLDINRIPLALRSELIVMALLDADCDIPAKKIVEALANISVFSLMLDHYANEDVTLCVYITTLGAYAELDLALDDSERGYVKSLVG